MVFGRAGARSTMQACPMDKEVDDMGINIREKQDISWMLSSLGSGAAGVAGSNFLADYASIKNGSYAKLMKAYYGGNASSSVKSVAQKSVDSYSGKKQTALTSEESKAYGEVQSATDALKDSADKLLKTGTNSVFTKKDVTTKDENGVESTTKEYDMDGIYSAVSSFVSNYNSVIQAVDKADNDTISRRAASMMNATTSNLKSLLAVGISVNSDGTLSLDKDAFMEADMTTAKSLFNGTGSYGYSVSSQASMINYAADREVSKGSTYTTKGTYGSNYNSGSLYNGWF